MIYLDNSATTFPKPAHVYDVMDFVNRNEAVNAGRGSYSLAIKASKTIRDTKDKLRKIVNAEVDTPVVFSASITMALNQIVNGISWRKNDIVYVSPFEHNAVVRPLNMMRKRHGITVKEIPLKHDSYEIDIEKLKYEFSKDIPKAVFCTGVSNVIGYILPVQEIFSEAKKYKAITVLDTAQSLGLVELDERKLKVDFIAFAGHKNLYGPIGIGGFVNCSNMLLNEFFAGGTGSDSLNINMPDDLEGKYEAASSNIVCISGLNAALDVLDTKNNYEKEKELSQYLIEKLTLIPTVRMMLPSNTDSHIAVVSFVIEGMKSDDVGTILNLDYDIAVRTGYHCAPLIHKYLRDEKNVGTIRVGIGQFNTREDIDALSKALIEME